MPASARHQPKRFRRAVGQLEFEFKLDHDHKSDDAQHGLQHKQYEFHKERRARFLVVAGFILAAGKLFVAAAEPAVSDSAGTEVRLLRFLAGPLGAI